MKLGEVTRKRGEIAELFIGVETLIDIVISYHYFKDINNDFIFNVLKNENSNFGLRRNLFEKIISEYEKKIEIMDGIHRLNKIRNIFAHSLSKAAGDDADVFFSNPKLGDKDLDAGKLYDEFVQKRKSTHELILGLGKKYGLNFPR